MRNPGFAGKKGGMRGERKLRRECGKCLAWDSLQEGGFFFHLFAGIEEGGKVFKI